MPRSPAQRLPRPTRRSRAASKTGTAVPGPSANPATNLLLADILLRMGSMVLRRMIERWLLKGRYGPVTAREIVRGKGAGKTLARAVLARIGTGSIPGAVLVGSGLVLKLLLDRGRARRLEAQQALAEGDAELLADAQRARTGRARLGDLGEA